MVRAVKHAILSGRYRPGGTLPSARDLGDELKVNKNTASKAYRQLQIEGLVRIALGRRTTVAASPARSHHAPEMVIGRQLKSVLTPILREARLLGVAPARILEVVTQEIAAFQEGASRRVYLVECNRMEAQQHARDISDWLGVAVSWKLLDDLPGFSTQPSDVFVVPYYHLDDVAPHLPSAQIAGIHVAPDPEVLFTVIDAAQAGQVALICGNSKSAERFRNLFQYYTSKGIRITHHRDVKGMSTLLAAARTVFATPAAFARVEQHLGTAPTAFPERIDPRSLHSLRVLLSQPAGAPGRPGGIRMGAGAKPSRNRRQGRALRPIGRPL